MTGTLRSALHPQRSRLAILGTAKHSNQMLKMKLAGLAA